LTERAERVAQLFGERLRELRQARRNDAIHRGDSRHVVHVRQRLGTKHQDADARGQASGWPSRSAARSRTSSTCSTNTASRRSSRDANAPPIRGCVRHQTANVPRTGRASLCGSESAQGHPKRPANHSLEDSAAIARQTFSTALRMSTQGRPLFGWIGPDALSGRIDMR
jgi:hypothetical protein